ncbi:helicase domino [Trichonephila clavipes]|nr:helicase domino [Trichonephila clavipes]
MIQARKDGNITKEQTPEDPVTSSPSPRTAPATIRTIHSIDQRRATFVTNTVGGPTAVILSEGSAIPEGTLQYRRVSIGPTLQHVVTPIQGTSTATTPVTVNPRCTVTSTSDLAHLLVAATSNSSHHSVELQNSIVNVSASMPQQFQTIGNITNVVTSAQRTASAAVIAQPVSQAPRIVLNSGGISDVYALHITPTTLGSGGSSQQIMVLDSSASLTPSSDVTKVHSYSLASAAVSSLASTSTMQKIVITASGQPIQVATMASKSPITQNQLRTGVKRQLLATSPVRASVLTVNNSELMLLLSSVNKLLYGLMPYEGKVSSIPSSPKAKRIKLEKSAVITKDLTKRKKVSDYITKKNYLLKIKYYQSQAEYYFLKSGGNLVDYVAWRKKVKPQLLEYLKVNRFEPADDVKIINEILSDTTLQPIGNPVIVSQDNYLALHLKYDFWHMTATAGSDVVQSGHPIFDDFFQHLWPYIGNNMSNVVFQMVKRLWLIRIDHSSEALPKMLIFATRTPNAIKEKILTMEFVQSDEQMCDYLTMKWQLARALQNSI